VHPGHCPVKCCFLEGEALIMICNSCTKDHDPILQKHCTQKSWPNTSKTLHTEVMTQYFKNCTEKSYFNASQNYTQNCHFLSKDSDRKLHTKSTSWSTHPQFL
jgi:hypothetical protein